MISSSPLNKLIFSIIFFTILTFSFAIGEEEPVDIWKKKENKNEQINNGDEKKILL